MPTPGIKGNDPTLVIKGSERSTSPPGHIPMRNEMADIAQKTLDIVQVAKVKNNRASYKPPTRQPSPYRHWRPLRRMLVGSTAAARFKLRRRFKAGPLGHWQGPGLFKDPWNSPKRYFYNPDKIFEIWPEVTIKITNFSKNLTPVHEFQVRITYHTYLM